MQRRHRVEHGGVSKLLAGISLRVAVASWVGTAMVGGTAWGGMKQVSAEVRGLVGQVADESLPQARRDEAARRLAARTEPEARQALVNFLVDAANRGGQLAVARALSAAESNPGTDESLIAPLNALLGNDRQLTEAAAQALTYYRTSLQVVNLLTASAVGGPGGAGNAGRPEPARAAVIRALGAFVDQRVAQTLMELLQSQEESTVIRGAAADALMDMTGYRSFGSEVGEWRAWWARASQLDEGQFRTQMLLSRAGRLDQVQRRYEQLTEELVALLSEGYRITPDSQKLDRLLRLLQSPRPEVRVAAVRIVTNDALENRTVPASARELLRSMVADSAPEVRLEAATAIRSLNDAAALEALLKQLAVEPVPEVRAGIAQTLGPIRDLRAVGPLIDLLKDRYLKVAEAAADALAALGPQVRRDRAMSDRVAVALKEVLETRATGRDAQNLRAGALEALVPLRRREMLPMVQQLLGANEAARVRRAALRLMAELREPDTAVSIIAALDSSRNEPGVRLEAVNALGAIPTFEHAETLFRRISPEVEPDATVQARAWAVLSDLFPLATRDQLLAWAERFANEPARRIVVLRALAAKLNAPGDEESLALTRQQIGETLLKLGQYSDAIRPLEDALAYWRQKRVFNMFTESLYQETIEALVRARQYPQAAAFAARSIGDSETNQPTMGTRLVGEVRSLIDLEDLASAASLLNEIQRMNPSLATRYQEELNVLATVIRDGLGPVPLPATQPSGQGVGGGGGGSVVPPASGTGVPGRTAGPSTRP